MMDPESVEPPRQDDLAGETAFVQNIKLLRLRRGLSQTELAKKAQEAGLAFHQPTIQRIEDGERPVKLGEALVLAEILGSSLHSMMRDYSVAMAYERLVKQLHKAWTTTQETEGNRPFWSMGIRSAASGLKESVETYQAALKRSELAPETSILDAATETLRDIEVGLGILRDAEARAKSVWVKIPDPSGRVPMPHEGRDPFEQEGDTRNG